MNPKILFESVDAKDLLDVARSIRGSARMSVKISARWSFSFDRRILEGTLYRLSDGVLHALLSQYLPL